VPYFVSITRLRLRSARFLPMFMVFALRSLLQARRASGFQAASLLADRRWTFWTMTVWNGQESMKAFMTTGAHRSAMPHLLNWCDEASLVHWEQSEPLTSWPEADRRLRAEGRPSKVRFPSVDHVPMTFAHPRHAPVVPIKAR
jgi:hypothetical protein